MSFLVRKAHPEDASRLAKLLAEYMLETYDGTWGGGTELLKQHLSDEAVEIFLSEKSDGEVIGFLAWTTSYDLHWCMKGAVVIDLYVCPRYRSRGVAVLLATELAAEVRRNGGTHLKGGAVESTVANRLYDRIAVLCGGSDYYLSGRAFRHFAELSGKGVRGIARDLPEKAWNYQS